jgi:acetyl-CoA carboxylase biotin carboxyl carrier protein
VFFNNRKTRFFLLYIIAERISMDLNYLRKLIKIFDESSANDLSIEEEGIKLKISKTSKEGKGRETQVFAMQPYMQQPFAASAPPAAAPVTINAQPAHIVPANELTETDEGENLHKINSPIVGTFYRAPSPDSEPFAEVGTHVVPGQTLCIIEAMKLMNEIESDIAGTIVKILVQNGQPIEYNQALFFIKPD